MLRYESKNALMDAMAELMATKKYDAEIRNGIVEAILNTWCLPEEIMKNLLKSPKYNGDEEFIMQMALSYAVCGENFNQIQFESHFRGCVHLIDANLFKENPYIKNIRFDNDFNIDEKNINLSMGHFDKYELIENGNVMRRKDFITKPNVGFFNEIVYYPALFQDEEVWMTITPSEINTMQHHIDTMKGNVVVFGLGLGYFAYMTALKDNVETVTVIEVDQGIIDIFNQYILPQFDEQTRNKISIKRYDAKEKFLDKEYMKQFDSCFIDIWRNAVDGIPLYGYFKENEKLHKVKPRYWLEEEFFHQYQDTLFFYIMTKLVYGNKSAAPISTGYEYLDYMNKKIDSYFSRKKYILKNKQTLINLLFDKKIMRYIFSMKIEE